MINENTIEDLNKINKDEMKNKLKDIKYIQIFLKQYVVKNNIKITYFSIKTIYIIY